jgi:hypothetical protein
MCDPISLTVAATAVTAIGQGMNAMQQAATYRYQAKIADRNAQSDIEAGRMAQDNAKLEAQRRYRQGAQVEGQQVAAMAANGVDLGFGNALNLQSDTAMITADDVGQIYRQAYQDQRTSDIKVFNDRAQASASRQAAAGAITKGIFDVGSTILGGATQFSKMKAGG